VHGINAHIDKFETAVRTMRGGWSFKKKQNPDWVGVSGEDVCPNHLFRISREVM